MKNFVKILGRTLCAVLLLTVVLSAVTATAYAADSETAAAAVQTDNSVSAKAIAVNSAQRDNCLVVSFMAPSQDSF